MLKRHSFLVGIIIGVLLLVVAARYYPGGSQEDKNSIGYDWKNNYLCNLFSEKSINGADNTSRPWAIAGMFFLCAGFALFFIDFSKKISLKGAARVIRYCGAGAMVFALLVVTPWHDLMVTVAGTLALVSMFYITLFVFKSKLHFFKILSILCLLVFYCCNYIYYSGNYLQFLPIMQKIVFVVITAWMVGLEYFTGKEDFQYIKTGRSINKKEITKP